MALSVTTTTATENGSVPAGALRLLFIFSADFAGTVNGGAYDGAEDASIPFEAGEQGARLPAIAYTVTAGNVRIIDTR